MAVVAGTDKPTAAQYNSVQTTINTVLATKYGQGTASSQIALPGTSTKVTATAWGNLRADILRANRHQLNPATVGTLTNPTTSTVIAAADYNAYETMANACLTNSLLFPDNSTISSNTFVCDVEWRPALGAWGRTGRNTMQATILLEGVGGASTDATNYFFNSGGQLRISAVFSGGTVATAGTKDFSWKSAVNEMGTIIFGKNNTRTLAGATGAGTGSNIGFSQLNNNWQLIFTKNTSTYTPNKITIHAKTFTVPDVFTNLPQFKIAFVIQYQDLNDPGGTYTIDEDVSATLHSYVFAYYGSGTGEVDVTAYKPVFGSGSGIAISNGPNPA
jgi:hypothetical protein